MMFCVAGGKATFPLNNIIERYAGFSYFSYLSDETAEFGKGKQGRGSLL